MSNATDLAKRFKEVMLDGQWVANTNFQLALSDVTYQQANEVVHDLNAIAHLAQHVHYYIAGVLQVLQGGALEVRDQYSFDFPPITDAAEWEACQEKIFHDSRLMVDAIEQLDAEKLQAEFVNPKYGSYQRNIEGLIEHAYYHLGQISLIKKIVR